VFCFTLCKNLWADGDEGDESLLRAPQLSVMSATREEYLRKCVCVGGQRLLQTGIKLGQPPENVRVGVV
jgi:hypothetical protein